jgi:hypothetical protein
MPTLRLFGALSCVILIIALLADLFFLPALVCVAGPKRRSSSDNSSRESERE